MITLVFSLKQHLHKHMQHSVSGFTFQPGNSFVHKLNWGRHWLQQNYNAVQMGSSKVLKIQLGFYRYWRLKRLLKIQILAWSSNNLMGKLKINHLYRASIWCWESCSPGRSRKWRTFGYETTSCHCYCTWGYYPSFEIILYLCQAEIRML